MEVLSCDPEPPGFPAEPELSVESPGEEGFVGVDGLLGTSTITESPLSLEQATKLKAARAVKKANNIFFIKVEYVIILHFRIIFYHFKPFLSYC